ncbi:hypothetical protein F9L16_02120 [Agarivorans sp. B2Z047]|nr:hypothetical protein [Agarivorans sp. B2Z047]MPW27790.1 hypothetical protein [Agarivorans sp. B2Z047]
MKFKLAPKIGLIMLLLITSSIKADECFIPVVGFEKELKQSKEVVSVVTVGPVKNPKTGELQIQHFATLINGDVLTVRELNCLMWNLEVSLLSQKTSDVSHIANQLANAINLSPLGKRFYKNTDIESVLIASFNKHSVDKAFHEVLYDELNVASENAEPFLDHLPLTQKAVYSPYKQLTSVTISVGGL